MQYNQHNLPRLSDFEEEYLDNERSYDQPNPHFYENRSRLFSQASDNFSIYKHIKLEPSIIPEKFTFSLEAEEMDNSGYEQALSLEEFTENDSIINMDQEQSAKQSLNEILNFLESGQRQKKAKPIANYGHSGPRISAIAGFQVEAKDKHIDASLQDYVENELPSVKLELNVPQPKQKVN